MSPDVFCSDDSANVQVIAGLLLAVVAIVLAVVVGVVVFDFDERFLEEDRPSVSFQVEYDADAEELTIRHHSGRTLQGDRVEFVSGDATLGTWSSDSEVTAGDAIVIGGVGPDQTVVVYWIEEDGDRHELRRWRGPTAPAA